MPEYMKKFEKVEVDIIKKYGDILPDNVITFIAMLEDAVMGIPYSYEDKINYTVAIDTTKNEVRVTNLTDEFGFVFSVETGQLLYTYNWKD